MLIIKVWCLPPNQSEEKLNQLHKSIVGAAMRSVFSIKSENDMVCLFPPDLMKYGLGEEIVVEITGLTEDPKKPQLRQLVATSVGMAISEIYSNSKVVCSAQVSDPNEGSWTSPDPITCDNCGQPVVRCGTCVKCYNCGNTVGGG